MGLTMSKNKKEKKDPVQHETEYVAFLKKRLDSAHFQANASEEEKAETKRKYDRAKLKLRLLQGKF